MTDKPTVSICIPSYNRPLTLLRLLESIDAKNPQDLEIIICEDNSPQRTEIMEIVSGFRKKSPFKVHYFENQTNYGFDRNLRECILHATGDYVIFMGDDDTFEPEAIDKMANFLKQNSDLGYVLKRHTHFDENNRAVEFRYYGKTRFFNSGIDSYVELFRKSVFISGFTIRREWTLPHLINDLDGSLLFQLYLLAEVTLKHRSAYLDIPFTRGFEGGIALFGSSSSEMNFYTPGPVTVRNSINFLSWYLRLTEFIDKKHGINSTLPIQKNMSKYFYPSLAIQRNNGLLVFFDYVRRLNRLGFNTSAYYYLYIILLVLLGKRICDNAIRILKSLLGRTPRL